MEVKGVPEKERNERLDTILNLVGLKDTADLYPNPVSTSMMQRIGPRFCRQSRPAADGRALWPA